MSGNDIEIMTSVKNGLSEKIQKQTSVAVRTVILFA